MVRRASSKALQTAGHEVAETDLARPIFERKADGTPRYVQVDLTQPGEAFSIVHGRDAVVHVAPIPKPTGRTRYTVTTNLMAAFNMLEAAVRFGVKRFVNISSETVPGFISPERPFLPDYAPVDEEHPVNPQDPYALSKMFSEKLMEAAAQRRDILAIPIRPSWVQFEENYENNLGPQVRDASVLSPNLWSYINVYDLADAIVSPTESDLPGHEVFYIASPDNVGGRDFAAILREHYGDKIELRAVNRADASRISCVKAAKMLGWSPKRSWRDYFDSESKALWK